MLEINKVYIGDCLELMPSIEDKSIDMILCDLPYGVTARNKWDVPIPLDLLWKEYKRIIKDNGAILLFGMQPFTSLLVTSNLPMFKYELIWRKQLPTGFLNAKKQPLRNHESLLVFYKKQPTYNPQFSEGKPYKVKCGGTSANYGKQKSIATVSDGTRYPLSVLDFAGDKNKLHPTQKPVALCEYLIKTYTNENELVLDNCAGSGSTGVACQNTNRSYILIEKEPKYYNIINQRLKENSNS